MMWKTQTTIEYPFALRPASIEEAGLFYSQMDEAEDAVLGTVGHIRMDFGASGKEFYHTWWPHNGDQFNTGEFKDELQKFVDMLRADGPLTNLASMRNYCYQHGGIKECPEITVTWFRPDEKKDGGQYITTTGRLRRIDEFNQVLILVDDIKIPLTHVVDLDSEKLPDMNQIEW